MNEQRWLARSERWLRILLRLYPVDFRDEMGDAVVNTYRERCRTALRTGGRLSLTPRVAACALGLAAQRPGRARAAGGLLAAQRQLGARPGDRDAASRARAAVHGGDGRHADNGPRRLRGRLHRGAEGADRADAVREPGRPVLRVAGLRKDLRPEARLARRDRRRRAAEGGGRDRGRGGSPATADRCCPLREGTDPTEIAATIATPNLFDLLGVRPAMGRGFPPTKSVLPRSGDRPDARTVEPAGRGSLDGRAHRVADRAAVHRDWRDAPRLRLRAEREPWPTGAAADAYTTFSLNLAETNPSGGSYRGADSCAPGTPPETVTAAVGAVGRAIDARDFKNRGLKLYPLGSNPISSPASAPRCWFWVLPASSWCSC